MAIDPGAPGFTGTISIDVAINRPTRVIWLNARALALDTVELTAAGTTRPARVLADPRADHAEGQSELIGLSVDDVLPIGQATIRIAYRGAYGDTVGLIKTATETPFIYSDSQPTDARAVMPCFDEPTFKTPWQISLVVPSQLLALAHSP